MDTADTLELEQIKTRLEENYAYIRSVIQPGYEYYPSPKFDKAFIKASKFCKDNDLSPEEYAYGLMYSLELGRKECFYPSYFGSATANQAVMQYKKEKAIAYEDLLEHQKDLLYLQINKLGRDYKTVLMDPRLKFYAWFRILATAKPESDIVNRYSDTARAEMTPELLAFLKQNNLDLNRIL
jgi:hypothetical protein